MTLRAPDETLTRLVTEMASELQPPLDLARTLTQLTTRAVDTISAIDHASISVTGRGGRIHTLAPTGELALRADELQYELNEGPCLRAALDEPMVQVDDLASDPRWPAYGPRAAGLGLGAQLAFQFRARPDARGALNLYAGLPHTIDDQVRQLSAMFASLVAVVMGWAGQERNLTAAMESRKVIGQAVGIVMERYRLDPDRAFEFLVRTSQAGNIKVRQVAERIIADACSRPSPVLR